MMMKNPSFITLVSFMVEAYRRQLKLWDVIIVILQNGDADEGKSRNRQYEGLDPDLAAMLERDVLETSPGVRWDDVAGLLEEAVVLPLWMPEYFQAVTVPLLLNANH